MSTIHWHTRQHHARPHTCCSADTCFFTAVLYACKLCWPEPKKCCRRNASQTASPTKARLAALYCALMDWADMPVTVVGSSGLLLPGPWQLHAVCLGLVQQDLGTGINMRCWTGMKAAVQLQSLSCVSSPHWIACACVFTFALSRPAGHRIVKSARCGALSAETCVGRPWTCMLLTCSVQHRCVSQQFVEVVAEVLCWDMRKNISGRNGCEEHWTAGTWEAGW